MIRGRMGELKRLDILRQAPQTRSLTELDLSRTQEFEVIATDPTRRNTFLKQKFDYFSASSGVVNATFANLAFGTEYVSELTASVFVICAAGNAVMAALSVAPYKLYDRYGKRAMDVVEIRTDHNFTKPTPTNHRIAKFIQESRHMKDSEYCEIPVSNLTGKPSDKSLVFTRDTIYLRHLSESPIKPTDISEGQWQKMFDHLDTKEISDKETS